MRSDVSVNTIWKEKCSTYSSYKEKTVMVQKYSEKETPPKKQRKEEAKTKKDEDGCWVSACGCRGACMSTNEERLNEGPRLSG